MRRQNQIPRFALRAVLLASLCLLPSHALYTSDAITAYRVDDNAFVIDGKPDSLWRTIFAEPNGNRSISFQDYSKMVILQPDSVRNQDPAKYVKNPSPGSATLIAAYDSKALYFFFLVKAGSYADPKALGCPTADLWKPDAVDLYLDPSAWSAGSTDYRTYFYTDASGLIFGTSPRTIQVVRPIKDTRLFYRNRSVGERFQVRDTLPNGLSVAVSARTPADTGWVGVEMRIPFWTSAADFARGRSMFASWGFNRYGDSARTDCNGTPLIYRWAKNILNYDFSAEKPPGWKAGDSTHYDPVRSWDGWGQLFLIDQLARNRCSSRDPKDAFDSNWDASYWSQACGSAATGNPSRPLRLDAPDGARFPNRPPRDARGRARPASASPAYGMSW
jgi:hypothetical protein